MHRWQQRFNSLTLQEKIYNIRDFITTDGRTKISPFSFNELDDGAVEKTDTVKSLFSKSDLKRIWARIFESGEINYSKGKIQADQLRTDLLRIV